MVGGETPFEGFFMWIICLLLLIICSYTDLRERGISIWLLAASLISCVLLMICVEILGDSYEYIDSLLIYEPDISKIVCSLIPGMVLFAVSRLTKEAIGMGDVYVMLLLGFMMGFANTAMLMFVSMFTASLFGIILMLFKGKNRKETLPYMPFLLGAYVWMLFSGMIRGAGLRL